MTIYHDIVHIPVVLKTVNLPFIYQLYTSPFKTTFDLLSGKMVSRGTFKQQRVCIIILKFLTHLEQQTRPTPYYYSVYTLTLGNTI